MLRRPFLIQTRKSYLVNTCFACHANFLLVILIFHPRHFESSFRYSQDGKNIKFIVLKIISTIITMIKMINETVVQKCIWTLNVY